MSLFVSAAPRQARSRGPGLVVVLLQAVLLPLFLLLPASAGADPAAVGSERSLTIYASGSLVGSIEPSG